MDTDNKELIEKILKVFNKKGYQVKKIFYNEPTSEAIIIAPVNDMDGIFVYTSKSNKPIPFVPSENFKLYDKIVKDENIIYDRTELDDIVHSTEYGKGFYQKIEKYYPDGRTRYFYSPQEWAAYQENKGQDEFRKQQAKKKIAETKNDMSKYNSWEKEKEEIKKEEARLKSLHETQARLKKEREENTRKILEKFKLEQEIKEKVYQDKAMEYSKQMEEQKRQEEALRKTAQMKKEFSNWLSSDPNSPVNVMESVINFSDGLDERIPSLEELNDNDHMIDEVYQWMAENKEMEMTDPKTGLKLKNYDLPIEEEMKLVNPGFYYSDEYTVFRKTHDELEYVYKLVEDGSNLIDNSMNCYACTTAMALRQKGYDVTAGKDDNGIDAYTVDSEIGEAYDNLWTGKFTEYDYFNETKSSINKEPPGSYGDFNFQWVLPNGLSQGHSIFYKVDYEGNVHYYDCQNGKEMSNLDFDKLIKDSADEYATYYYSDGTVKEKKTGKKMVYSRYKRLDNQEFVGAEAMKNANKISSTIVVKGGN